MSLYNHAYRLIEAALDADRRGDYREAERLRERARQAEEQAEREEYTAMRARRGKEAQT